MKLEGGKRGQCPILIPTIFIPDISQKLFFNCFQTKNPLEEIHLEFSLWNICELYGVK